MDCQPCSWTRVVNGAGVGDASDSGKGRPFSGRAVYPYRAPSGVGSNSEHAKNLVPPVGYPYRTGSERCSVRCARALTREKDQSFGPFLRPYTKSDCTIGYYAKDYKA